MDYFTWHWLTCWMMKTESVVPLRMMSDIPMNPLVWVPTQKLFEWTACQNKPTGGA